MGHFLAILTQLREHLEEQTSVTAPGKPPTFLPGVTAKKKKSIYFRSHPEKTQAATAKRSAEQKYLRGKVKESFSIPAEIRSLLEGDKRYGGGSPLSPREKLAKKSDLSRKMKKMSSKVWTT